MKTAPYGSWKSPITADLVAGNSRRLGQPRIQGNTVFWLEGRPEEKGRLVLCRWTDEGGRADLTPAPYSVRTAVHEYGGGAWGFAGDAIVFANWSDQHLYRLGSDGSLTTLVDVEGLRFADFRFDRESSRIYAVCEDHRAEGEARNYLVSIADDPTGTSIPQELVGGNDFYASPRVSPDGKRLLWITWNHPEMQWDSSELWVADIDLDGSLSNHTQVAGGKDEAICQPEWLSDEEIVFHSDRTDFWNPYIWNGLETRQILDQPADYNYPHWNFDDPRYAVLPNRRLLATSCWDGIWKMSIVDVDGGSEKWIEMPSTNLGSVRADNTLAVFLAASPIESTSVVRLDLETGNAAIVRRAADVEPERAYISVPGAIEFPTENGLTSHGFYYPPHNPDFTAPEGELPPLVVISHGGPTGLTSTALNPGTQYWTSRGFAVLDVNYSGSAGYGRQYRERLQGTWGVTDVDDCINGAQHLVDQGMVDGDRLVVRGWSASGYLTLCAITFRDVFKVGSSHFGISDLEAMELDTHKFESKYLDGLIGPYPERKDLFIERSPIHHVDQIDCALLLFQGLEDKVVPPNQAEMMYDAVAAKGHPVAYIAFEGEQHGFRQASSIKRALEAELYFLSQVLGFELAEQIKPVPIANL